MLTGLKKIRLEEQTLAEQISCLGSSRHYKALWGFVVQGSDSPISNSTLWEELCEILQRGRSCST